MFTGLIEKTALIAEKTITGNSGKLILEIKEQFEQPVLGESIAVNGVCLTLESFADETLSFHVLEETFSRSNLGTIQIGGKVNLERALAVGDRLGGHMVSGHVDTVSEVLEWREKGNDFELVIALPDSLKPYLVPKGSIAVDGVSLTIVALKDSFFSVHLIPTTLADTALRERGEGAMVNLEGDLIGKYVSRQLAAYSNGTSTSLTMETLIGAGW